MHFTFSPEDITVFNDVAHGELKRMRQEKENYLLTKALREGMDNGKVTGVPGDLKKESISCKAINDAINHHISLLNFNAEIKLAEKELYDSSSESVTNRIEKASTNLQNAVKGSEPKILDNDELRKASIKRLNIMIENKIWLKKK